MHQNSPLPRLCLLDPTFLKSINKYIRKTPSKGTREEKKDRSLNKRQHLKAQNAQWGAARGGIK
jgi:hypothetical protein